MRIFNESRTLAIKLFCKLNQTKELQIYQGMLIVLGNIWIYKLQGRDQYFGGFGRDATPILVQR